MKRHFQGKFCLGTGHPVRLTPGSPEAAGHSLSRGDHHRVLVGRQDFRKMRRDRVFIEENLLHLQLPQDREA